MKLLQSIGFIFFFPFVFGYDHTITCPKSFRLGAEETVVLNLHGYSDGATLNAHLEDPGNVFSETSNMVLSNIQTTQPIELRMRVRPEDVGTFRRFHRVTLVVNIRGSNNAGNFEKRLEVLVTKRSGYLFLITDRPIYRPSDTVSIKVFPLDQSMNRDEKRITVTIKTPDDIGVKTYDNVLRRSNSFILVEHVITSKPEFGLWSAEVRYQTEHYETTSDTKFEVQRYVLPTFDVNIEMAKNFVLTTDEDVRGVVKAIYSYGEDVQGSLYLSMKIKTTKDTKNDDAIEFFTIPGPEEYTAAIQEGRYEFHANFSYHLATALNNTGKTINSIQEDGGSVFIDVTVTEAGSGYLESAQSPDIPIVISPHSIDTKRTSLYFTPGLVYRLQVDVLYSIGRISVNEPVLCHVIVNNGRLTNRNTNARGQLNYGISFSNGNRQNITVRTTGPKPAQVTFNVEPYESPSGNYLQITVEDNQLHRVGLDAQLTFSFNDGGRSEIRYFVISRGSIVHSGINMRGVGNQQSSEEFPITQEMVPSARVVAYYLVGTEIVSNSVWFDVEDQCKTELEMNLAEAVIDPTDGVTINLRGPPGALVSISAVDRAAYFLYGGSRLTRDVMFNKMESYDQGCQRNGGRDGPGVFWEAGLTVSSEQYSQHEVFNLNCTSSLQSRKKRQASSSTVDTELAAYNERELVKCINDGKLTAAVDGENCTVRKAHCLEYNPNFSDCCDAFEKTCIDKERDRLRNLIFGLIGRSSGSGGATSRNFNGYRKSFQENMLFEDFVLRSDGTLPVRRPASDSITTFEIDAVSMENNASDGFCVAKTKNLRIFRNVFLQIYAPYALKRMEQANLRVAVFNYGDDPVTVAVEVNPSRDEVLCTYFQPGVWSHVSNLTIASHRSASLPITVVPLKLGSSGVTEIKFRVRFPNGASLDGIEKKLFIEEVGEVKDSFDSKSIDLKSQRQQTFDLHLKFPEKPVANSIQCWLYAYSNFLGPSIEVNPVTKEPRDIDTIFRMPYGCGEQNMAVSAPNVYAHMYLETTGQFNDAERDASLERLRKGYERQLSHRSEKLGKVAFAYGSYADPSTWLNAFVDKVFMKANVYHSGLDVNLMCNSLRWLLTQQHDDGYFIEEVEMWLAWEISSSVGGHITLTSYVAVSLLETQSSCSTELNQQITTAVTNAMNYLIRNEHSPILRRNFPLSLFTYALALHQPTSAVARRAMDRFLLARISQNGRIHWRSTELETERYVNYTIIYAAYNSSVNYYLKKIFAKHVEITAYGLLALIERERRLNNQQPSAIILEITRKIVLWLIEQRNDGGAFISTQDTVIGLQALATYETWIAQVVPRNDTEFSIQFTAPGTQWDNPDMAQFPRLTDADSRVKHELRVPKDVLNHQNVTVTARGFGEGVVSYRCVYHTLVDESGCNFILSYNVSILNQEQVDSNQENMRIKLTVTAATLEGETGMANIEVGLLSGFFPIQDTLERLSQEKAKDGVVSRYEVSDVKVVFYLRRITQTPLTLAFVLRQRIFVNQPQPAKINVYDYYEPSTRCGIFYSLPTYREHILTSGCQNRSSNLCKCAEGGCMLCRSREQQMSKSLCFFGTGFNKTCDTCEGRGCKDMFNIACRRNYVYQLVVTSISLPGQEDVFYNFDATITDVLREGNVEGVRNGSEVTFVVRKDCFENCNDDVLSPPDKTLNKYSNVIKINSTLLVLGRPADRYVDKDGNQKYQFLLDDKAIIERVIRQGKCEAFKKKCPKAGRIKCDELRKRELACKNYQRLKLRLREGCDP